MMDEGSDHPQGGPSMGYPGPYDAIRRIDTIVLRISVLCPERKKSR